MFKEDSNESETKYVISMAMFLVLIMLWVVTGSVSTSPISSVSGGAYSTIIVLASLLFSTISCLIHYNKAERLKRLNCKYIYLIVLTSSYSVMILECQIWLYVCTIIMLLNLIKALKVYLLFKYNEVN